MIKKTLLTLTLFSALTQSNVWGAEMVEVVDESGKISISGQKATMRMHLRNSSEDLTGPLSPQTKIYRVKTIKSFGRGQRAKTQLEVSELKVSDLMKTRDTKALISKGTFTYVPFAGTERTENGNYSNYDAIILGTKDPNLGLKVFELSLKKSKYKS